MFRKEYEGLLK